MSDQPFFTKGMKNLLILAIAMLIMVFMFGNLEEKKFTSGFTEEKSFSDK